MMKNEKYTTVNGDEIAQHVFVKVCIIMALLLNETTPRKCVIFNSFEYTVILFNEIENVHIYVIFCLLFE